MEYVEFGTLDKVDIVTILLKHKEFIAIEKERFTTKNLIDTTGIVK